jgi:hypothetical protein
MKPGLLSMPDEHDMGVQVATVCHEAPEAQRSVEHPAFNYGPAACEEGRKALFERRCCGFKRRLVEKLRTCTVNLIGASCAIKNPGAWSKRDDLSIDTMSPVRLSTKLPLSYS